MNQLTSIPTVKDLLKTKDVFRYQENQKLSEVLSKLKSSHDAAFVFNDNDEFIGVCSPIYLTKSRSLNTQSKLKSCVKMPPKMSLTDSLKELAREMIESRIYFLPVMDKEDHFLGIVTINRLLSYLSKKPQLLNSGHIVVSNRQLITINQDVSVSQALKLMREYRIAKLPVLNGAGSLMGVLSNFDLTEILEQPQSKGPQDRSGEKKRYKDEPVKNYMRQMPVTLDHVPRFVEAIAIMKDRRVGSIIIIDKNNKPMGIITKKDLLQTITTLPKL